MFFLHLNQQEKLSRVNIDEILNRVNIDEILSRVNIDEICSSRLTPLWPFHDVGCLLM